MKTIGYPKGFNIEYYDRTLYRYKDITLNSVFDRLDPEEYKKSRTELRNNYKLTFLADEWLDFFCDNSGGKKIKLPIPLVQKHMKKYWEVEIPIGCIILAILHRQEEYIVDVELFEVYLLTRKSSYKEFVEWQI